jgi:hypothetical protein
MKPTGYCKRLFSTCGRRLSIISSVVILDIILCLGYLLKHTHNVLQTGSVSIIRLR